MEDRKKGPTPENKTPSKHGHGTKPNGAEKPEDEQRPGSKAQSQAENGQNEEGGKDGETSQVPMIALSMEEFEALQTELEKARTKSNDYFDGWQRERADFSNYKKRVERDASLAKQNALVTIVKKYLVILDDLERALKVRPTGGEGAGWAEGIELIYRKLANQLEQEGISRMEAEKEYFDPNRHEAILQGRKP